MRELSHNAARRGKKLVAQLGNLSLPQALSKSRCHLVARNREPRVALPPQLKRTYSKSIGCLLIPVTGGAIQLANLPGSTTRPIKECTNARSSAPGNQLPTFSSHSASLS